MIKRKTTYAMMAGMIGLTLCLFTGYYVYEAKQQAASAETTWNLEKVEPEVEQIIYGEMKTELSRPMDVFADAERIYVSDTRNYRVQVFDRSGKSLFQFGEKGTGEGAFEFPYGISGDSKHRLYVADMYNGVIKVFDEDGKFLHTFKERTKVPILQAPAALRIVEDELYVTDVKLNKLIKFSLNGEKLLEIASGEQRGLSAPNGVAVSESGDIYISDSGNDRVLHFDKHGRFLHTINGNEESDSNEAGSAFSTPRGIALTDNDTLVIVEGLAHLVHIIDKNGEKLFTLGGQGRSDENLILPNGVYVDPTNRIYLTDTVNARVVVYK